MDIMWARRDSIDDPFPYPSIYRPEINSDANEHSPFLSADGTELFFASARGNGPYVYELWVARQMDSGSPSVIRCLTHRFMDCFAPCLSHDGRYLWFQSSSGLQPGKFALYMATRTGNGEFDDVVRLSSSADATSVRFEDNPWLSPDGQTLFFTAASDTEPRHVRALTLTR